MSWRCPHPKPPEGGATCELRPTVQACFVGTSPKNQGQSPATGSSTRTPSCPADQVSGERWHCQPHPPPSTGVLSLTCMDTWDLHKTTLPLHLTNRGRCPGSHLQDTEAGPDCTEAGSSAVGAGAQPHTLGGPTLGSASTGPLCVPAPCCAESLPPSWRGMGAGGGGTKG